MAKSESETKKELREEHYPIRIRERIESDNEGSYLGDAVLGGIDGGITTFAIVAGSIGGGFSGVVIVVLGIANLLADGLSMAVSNYMGTQSRLEQVEQTREEEHRQIDQFPRGEREEIRQIFAQKGFEGEILEKIVGTITSNRKVWVDTMLQEEHGMQLEGPNPLKAGTATFLAFLLVGLVPLLPFLVPGIQQEYRFLASILATGISFIVVGVLKGLVAGRSILRSSAETLLTGGSAAGIAYLVGGWIRQAYGAV